MSVSGDESLVLDLEKLFLAYKPVIWKKQYTVSKAALVDVSYDLKVVVVYNMTVRQIKDLLQHETRKLGYLVNVVPDEQSGEQTNATLTGAVQTAHHYKYLCRHATLAELKKSWLEHDILNCLNLLKAPEINELEISLIARFLDSHVFMDEISLAFARAGVFKRQAMDTPQMFELLTVSLNSVAFERKSFDHFLAIGKVHSKLWLKIANDYDFIVEKYVEMEKHEPFIHKLLDILKKVKDYPNKQTATLCISRNDFMQDKTGQFLQIEPNLWGAGYGPLGDRQNFGLCNLELQFKYSTPKEVQLSARTEVEPCIVDGLSSAWRYYGNKDEKKPGTPVTWKFIDAGGSSRWYDTDR